MIGATVAFSGLNDLTGRELGATPAQIADARNAGSWRIAATCLVTTGVPIAAMLALYWARRRSEWNAMTAESAVPT